MYFASDSRISWDKEPGVWDCGQKVFAANAGAEVFGFTGYVLLPQSILSKACSFIDRGIRASSASESFETRVAWLKDLAAREVAMHPNRRIEDFTITAFDVPHDSIDNNGFFFQFANQTLVLATDVGAITDELTTYIGKANHLPRRAVCSPCFYTVPLQLALQCRCILS